MRRVLIDLTPLRSSPRFRRLLIGQSCSGFGSQMTLVAVMFQIWHMTGSTVWTGAVGLAQAIPLIAFGLVGFAAKLINYRRAGIHQRLDVVAAFQRRDHLPAATFGSKALEPA